MPVFNKPNPQVNMSAQVPTTQQNMSLWNRPPQYNDLGLGNLNYLNQPSGNNAFFSRLNNVNSAGTLPYSYNQNLFKSAYGYQGEQLSNLQDTFKNSLLKLQTMNPVDQAAFTQYMNDTYKIDFTSDWAHQNPEFTNEALANFNKMNQGTNWGQMLGIGVQGLNALGGLWGAYNSWQGLKEAKSNNAFQRALMQKNLTNTVSDYNRLLEAKTRSAAVINNTSDEERDAYIEKHKLDDKL